MASKAGREALAINALGKFLEGFGRGRQQRGEFEAMAADRALRERQIKMLEEEEKRKARPKVIYDEESSQYIPVPPEYSDVEIRRRPSHFSSGKRLYSIQNAEEADSRQCLCRHKAARCSRRSHRRFQPDRRSNRAIWRLSGHR